MAKNNPRYPFPSYFFKHKNNIFVTTIDGDLFFIQGESEFLDSKGNNLETSDDLLIGCKHSLAPFSASVEAGNEPLSSDFYVLNYGGSFLARFFETACGLCATEGGYKVE